MRFHGLKGEGAWQADEAGRAIDDALNRWSEVVGEAWGVYDFVCVSFSFCCRCRKREGLGTKLTRLGRCRI